MSPTTAPAVSSATYNDLHASGTGKLVYWTRDFTDILDWQEDVYRYDLNSIGYTVVNPLWSEPRFVNRGHDDYRIFDQVARLRFTSPTIDAGDPRSDQGLPPYYNNLLTNPGFESGIDRLGRHAQRRHADQQSGSLGRRLLLLPAVERGDQRRTDGRSVGQGIYRRRKSTLRT